jgi:hypothetical protein
METKIMVLAAMLISVMMVAQQGMRNPQNRGITQHEQMKSELGLSDDQFARIQGIDKTYSEKHAEVRSDSTLSREVRFEKQQALRTAKENEIKAILTAEQNALREKKKAEHKEMRKGSQQKGKGYRNYHMKSSLSLTDDQKVKINEANTVYWEKRKALKNSPEYQSIQQEHDATVKSILSEQQYTQWKDEQRNGKGPRHPRGKK